MTESAGSGSGESGRSNESWWAGPGQQVRVARAGGDCSWTLSYDEFIAAPAPPAGSHDQTHTHTVSNNNNINNSHDNVYGAVIMTKVIARVHPVHLMNVG